jgi:uncharacterized membrane protein
VLPLMLLLVEIALVSAAGYIFWLTRRQLASLRTAANAPATSQPASGGIDQVEMMHDLADVLAEVRSTVQDMRAEWQRERDALRHQLEQADKTIAEMRAQMNRARTLVPQISVSGDAVEPLSRPSQPCPPLIASGTASIILGNALDRFTDHLAHSGLSPRSVKRISASVREFAEWFGGQCYAGLRVETIDSAHLERFVVHLRRRHLRQSTITRKTAAVKRFLVWTSSTSPAPIAASSADVPTPTRPTMIVEPMSVAERRAAVFDLAEQGLDTALIAARLGLERDTVHMLLSSFNGRRPVGGLSDPFAFNLGVGFAARMPQVVHGPLA